MTKLDRDKLEQFAKQVSGQVTAGFNCLLSCLGDRLGLYRALKEIGPTTSEGLAEHTGLSERWLREWLRHQACVGQVDYQDGAFSLSPEAAMVLAEDGAPFFFASGFDAVAHAYPTLDRLPEIFRTGLGLTYDDHGEACAYGIERLSSYTQRRELVPKIIPELDGVEAQLQDGIAVADIGCGAGASTIAMAEAFPNSTFTGYDTSRHAIDRALGNLDKSSADNVRFINPIDEPLPTEPTFDFVTTFDVVHDTPYPQQLIDSIFASITPDGTWLCSDIRSFPTFEQNLAEHPMAALLYGFSLTVCMSSSLSTPDGAGLGTLGFNEQVARQMTGAAGFKRFRQIDYGTPINSYYEIRV